MKNPISYFQNRKETFSGRKNPYDEACTKAYGFVVRMLIDEMKNENRETLSKDACTKAFDDCKFPYYRLKVYSDKKDNLIACYAFTEIFRNLGTIVFNDNVPLLELKFRCGEIITKTYEGAYLYKKTNPQEKSSIEAVLLDENGKAIRWADLD